jgi:16S rRNA (guanine527-N7)-methyltransferase
MSNAAPQSPAATPHEPPEPGSALDRFGSVTSQSKRALERYVALLFEWQRLHNLVAASTLPDVWTRHVADSLQLLGQAPSTYREWVDLGSGAGFPGLAIAIASLANTQRHFTLVEATGKKCAFLRAVVDATGANASVVNARIESHAKTMAGRADVISARALAPLPKLLGLALPYAHRDSVMLFPKGRDYRSELEAAAQSFDFDVVEYKSMTDSGGRVLAIRNLRPKVRR